MPLWEIVASVPGLPSYVRVLICGGGNVFTALFPPPQIKTGTYIPGTEAREIVYYSDTCIVYLAVGETEYFTEILLNIPRMREQGCPSLPRKKRPGKEASIITTTPSSGWKFVLGESLVNDIICQHQLHACNRGMTIWHP